MLLILLSLMQGGAFTYMKIGVGSISSFELVFLRVFFATILLSLFFGRRILSSQTLIFKNLYRLIILAFTSIICPFLLLAWAETKMVSGIPPIYMALIPVFVALIGARLRMEAELGIYGYLGLCLSITGVIILSIYAILLQGLSGILPNLACFSSAIFYSISIIKVRLMKDLSPSLISTMVVIISFFITIPFLAFNLNEIHTPSFSALLASMILGIASTSLALILMYHLVQKKGGVFATLANYFVPLAGLFWGGWCSMSQFLFWFFPPWPLYFQGFGWCVEELSRYQTYKNHNCCDRLGKNF